MIEIIEVTNPKIGNLYDSFNAYVQRVYGNKAEILFTTPVPQIDGKSRIEGTIKTSRGKYFDVVWSNGAYKSIEA